MSEKHPDFWKVKSHVHARGEAQARAQLAALVAQHTAEAARIATAALVTVQTAAGLDPAGHYLLDDEAETITLDERPAL